MLASVGGIAMSLHYERDCGTIERLLISPRGFTWLLLGKLGARWLIGFVQMSALLVWCHFVFAVSLGSSPWAAPVLTAVIVLATTALGMLVGSLVVTREQTLMVSLALVLVLCAFGGLWWPEQLEPPWMQSVAPAFFTTWAMRGMTDVVLRDRGLAGILHPIGMLLLHSLVLLALGLALFRARYSHR
jgi:ABC-2 type transport system permease protein